MRIDDRIWKPDLLSVLDWKYVDELTQKTYGSKATWWMQATPGVNYYRAEMPAKHLPGKTVRLETWDLQPDGKGGFYFPRLEGKCALWLFPGNVEKWLLMAEQAQQGKRVLVEVDDNYMIGPPVGELSSWAKRHRPGAHSYECHRKIIMSPACHGVVVATPKLAQVYEPLGKPVYICRNSVDEDDWQPDPPHQLDGILRIGWAGSASHRYDLADIRRALDWASRQKDVQVVILGQLEFDFPHWTIPWTDTLAQYRENVCAVDVMLCPIRPSEWADCKSDVKALEAAMGGACSVVSKTEPYRPWWDGEAPGYSASSPKDYLKVLKHLVSNREEARETARLAREYALTQRNIKNTIGAWREAVSGVRA